MVDDLPAGYELYRAEDHKLLVLPAEEVKNQRTQRFIRKEQEAAEAEAASRVAASEASDAPAAEPAQARWPAPIADPIMEPPLPGFHRVMPRFKEQTGKPAELELKTRSPDYEVCRRLEAFREQLAKAGPDRRIAKPKDWRAALELLEATLPNFAGPLRLLGDTLTLAETAAVGVRIPPMLLMGPPGIGKTYFTHKVAELLEVPHATVAFDQPSAGNQLRGSDKHWGNTQIGLLMKLICLGEVANPLILLDEIDKSARSGATGELDPLSQLHAALEPQTARCIQDASTDIEFDASLVTYIATANSLHGIGMPLLSRFEIFDIPPPDLREAARVAQYIVRDVVMRLGLAERLQFDRGCAAVLACLSPRLMKRAAERLAASALREGRNRVTEDHAWAALGWTSDQPQLH